MEDEKRNGEGSFGFEMEFVEEAMENRREDHTNARNESDSTEKCVAAGKKFAAGRLNGRKWPHSRQDHRRVRESIQP